MRVIETKQFSRFVPIKEWTDLTTAFLNLHVAKRKQELAKDKDAKGMVSLNTRKWVIRANPDGSVTILAPATKRGLTKLQETV